MALSKPYPIQKSDISFGADALYGLIDDLIGEGVASSSAFAVSQRSSGANMSVDIAAGAAYVAVDSPSEGGTRRITNPATINTGTPGSPNLTDGVTQTFTAADGTNPRVDRVVLTVRDNNVDAGGSYDAVIRVIPGTPTAGATLVNLTGAAAVPVNSILLANVLVPAGSTTVTTANIDTTFGGARQASRIGSGNVPVGGMTPIFDVVVGRGQTGDPAASASSIDSQTILTALGLGSVLPTTFKHLKLVATLRDTAAGNVLRTGLRMNNDSAANYVTDGIDNQAGVATAYNNVSTVMNVMLATGSTPAAGFMGTNEVLIPNYNATDYAKMALGTAAAIYASTSASAFVGTYSGVWSSTALTRLAIIAITGFLSGSRLTLYGLN